MQIDVNVLFLKRKDIWFDNLDDLANMESFSGYDYLIIHGINNLPNVLTNNKFVRVEKQNSLISDISGNLDEIKISKTVKKHINRAKRENVEIEIFNSSEILNHKSLLEEFKEMFKEMFKEKGMNRRLTVNILKQYAEQNRLIIATAMVNEKRIIFRAYVYDKKNSRALYSCSNFRTQNKELFKAFGRANEYIHWRCWEYFKSIGVVHYDWGGIYSFDKPNGIDKFKLQFCGKPVTYYNCVVPISIRYKLFCLIKKLFSWKHVQIK